MHKHVLYCADQNYFPYVMVSLRSLLVNSQKSDEFFVHFFVDNDDASSHPWFVKLQSEFVFQCHFYNLSNFDALSAVSHQGYYSPYACARLFLHELLPDHVNKVLYLDVDTLVLRDLESLFQLNIDECPIAAVQDLSSPKRITNRRHLGLDEEFYINSGVMMINLNHWRQCHISQLWMDFIDRDTTKQYSRMMDQDFLNAVFGRQIQTLPPIYNAFTLVKPIYEASGYTVFNQRHYAEFSSTRDLEDECVIRHFVGKYKPWQFKRILMSFKGNCLDTIRHLRLWYSYQSFFMSKRDRITFNKHVIFSLPYRAIASVMSPTIMFFKRKRIKKSSQNILDTSTP